MSEMISLLRPVEILVSLAVAYFELVFTIAEAIPMWVEVGLVVWMSGAIFFGCPRCYVPNLGWPLDILLAIWDKAADLLNCLQTKLWGKGWCTRCNAFHYNRGAPR